MSDEDAAALARSQAETIEATFRNEVARLTSYFRLRLRGTADPVDLAQEVFARLVSRASTSVIDNPAAYMTRIARNLLIDHGRRQKARADHEGDYDPAMVVPVPATQSQEIEASQMMERFRTAIDRLPPRTKEIFVLHHMDELLYREIAERLEISIRTVEWHMAEALLRLRRMMDE